MEEHTDEETQFKAYKEAIEKCNGHLCVIRTMDIGGDKASFKVVSHSVDM